MNRLDRYLLFSGRTTVCVFFLFAFAILHGQIDTNKLEIGETYSIKIQDQRYYNFEITGLTDSSIIVKSAKFNKQISLPLSMITALRTNSTTKHSIGVSLLSFEKINGINPFYGPLYGTQIIKLDEIFYKYHFNYYQNIKLSLSYSKTDYVTHPYNLESLDRSSVGVDLSLGSTIQIANRAGAGLRIGGFYKYNSISELSNHHFSSFNQASQNILGFIVQLSFTYELNKRFGLMVNTEYLTFKLRNKDRIYLDRSSSFNDDQWNPVGFLGLTYNL